MAYRLIINHQGRLSSETHTSIDSAVTSGMTLRNGFAKQILDANDDVVWDWQKSVIGLSRLTERQMYIGDLLYPDMSEVVS